MRLDRVASTLLPLMTFADPAAAAPAERVIVKEVVVAAPLDTVGGAWTTRAGIVGCFAPDAEIDPRVDGAFHIVMDPSALADGRGPTRCGPSRSSRSRCRTSTGTPAVRGQRTFVVSRFAPVDGRTRVRLHRTGWGNANGTDGPEADAAYRYFDRAWDGVTADLQKRLAAGGKPMDRTECSKGSRRVARRSS